MIGVIDSEHSQAHFFTDVHREILTTIASMTASRVSRALLDDELRRAHQKLAAKIAERTRELSAAIERSDTLLLNTLPAPIARRLQAGESTYLALRDKHRFERRRILEIKGIGAMPTYFLLGPA